MPFFVKSIRFPFTLCVHVVPKSKKRCDWNQLNKNYSNKFANIDFFFTPSTLHCVKYNVFFHIFVSYVFQFILYWSKSRYVTCLHIFRFTFFRYLILQKSYSHVFEILNQKKISHFMPTTNHKEEKNHGIK